jgi:hypothetical protein
VAVDVAGVSLTLKSDLGYSSPALLLTPDHFQPEAGGLAYTVRIVLDIFGPGSWNRITWLVRGDEQPVATFVFTC